MDVDLNVIKQDPRICCLQKTHHIGKDIHRLKEQGKNSTHMDYINNERFPSSYQIKCTLNLN